eukprot:TRINITY_DN3415_c0_g1_i1.p1 TRINITY_DN3415_c0_g1~~TRINITY_DN3415_c0_g1_i1.p1  ORF type:complete len:610 (-),score=110.60 TRINITY_DN3415_c0_g1_i1:102-1931(-)
MAASMTKEKFAAPSETTALLGSGSEKDMWKPTMGDLNCFFALLMNNLGAVIVTAKLGKGIFEGAFLKLGPELAPTNVDEIVFGTIIPGMVPTVIMGSLYYVWMTVRMLRAAPAGTSMTVFPYGVNTPAALCFIFAVMLPAISECVDPVKRGEMTANDAVKKAWAIGVVANLIGGIVSMLFAFVGPALVKVTPPAALMIALAGIGFTWLGINPLLDCFHFARCGMFTLILGMLLQLNVVKTGPFPPAIVLLVIGTCVGWMSGVAWEGGGSSQAVAEAASMIKPWLPKPIGMDVLSVVPEVLEKNIGVILPVAFTGAIGTLLNVNIAERAGDKYPLSETLLIDGATTVISALFGSPYGTCVYIGHPQFKEMGGKLTYPVMFCGAFTVLAMCGSFGLISALVPPYAIQPILIFIGLMIVTDAMSTAPTRHLPACVVGLFPAVAELVVKSGWHPIAGEEPAPWWGLQSLAQGSLLLCILWTCIFVSLIDSQFAHAVAWCIGGAALSAIGLIHQASVDFKFAAFAKSSFPFPADQVGTQPISLTMGYASLAALFGVLWFLQQKHPKSGIVGQPYSEDAEETDETKQAERLSLLVEEGRRRSSFIPQTDSISNEL